ncbi:MAG: hypothetical protein KGL29_07830 [Alphaproteobacteria bacterium]|nr:hypothetical protein [Alphaproteobacteria bacterium]
MVSDEAILRAVVQKALSDATDGGAVTIEKAHLKNLWRLFEARGKALEPFARLATDLDRALPDDAVWQGSAPVSSWRATCRALWV